MRSILQDYNLRENPQPATYRIGQLQLVLPPIGQPAFHHDQYLHTIVLPLLTMNFISEITAEEKKEKRKEQRKEKKEAESKEGVNKLSVLLF